MKKLLLILMLLILVIFSLYPEDVDGMDTSTKGKVTQEIRKENGTLKVHNNSKNEINARVEVNETVEKEFSVKIKGDLNTTKETVITLKAVVKNAQKLEACNYFWTEGKELIGLGETLEKSFTKGEHNITLVVRDANGEETNTSVIVAAYNYRSILKLHYDPYYGHLLYTERVIYNHKGRCVFFDDAVYSMTWLTYDDNDHMIERVSKYYHQPKENTKTEFTYDDKGNRLSSQTFNFTGESVHYSLSIYDDNSILIDMKFGTSLEDIENQPVYAAISYDEIVYDPTIYTEVKVAKDIIRMNDNKQVVYEERYYGDTKTINRMTYDDENKLIKSQRSSVSSYKSSSTTMEYDKEGNPINTERKYEMKGDGACHYSTANTYTSKGQVKSDVSVVLGGNCPYVDEVKRDYTYDDEGRVVKVKAMTEDGDMNEAFTTLKVIKEYSNEIDI